VPSETKADLQNTRTFKAKGGEMEKTGKQDFLDLCLLVNILRSKED
jgi:hypothetical protein